MKQVLALWLLLMSSWTYADTPERIVTIGGAMTEIIYALGVGDKVVGNDTTSYFPKAAEQKPKVGYQRMLSAEGVLSLNPDLVILTDEAGPPAVIAQIKSTGVKVLTLNAGRSVSDIKANIQTIARILARKDKATQLIASMEHQQKQLQSIVQKQVDAKKVMFVLQHGSGAPMVAGKQTAADSVIQLSGAVNVVGAYKGYKPLTPEAAVALAPDVILITTMGLAQVGGKAALLSTPGISLTPAAKQGNVIAMDPLMLIGFGPRTVEAAMQLNKAYQAF